MSERVGVDTTFMVQAEVIEAPNHAGARRYVEQSVLRGKTRLALAPQVLAEFVHIVTDPRRFAAPLDMKDALGRADIWWRAKEVLQVFPGPDSTDVFLDWMRAHQLGRKRLLDTQLAATYKAAGITRLLTSNARDYSVFGCFALIQPGG